MVRSNAFWYRFGDAKIMAGAQRRILVIEDDHETAEQLVDSLAASGYQVDLAVDGVSRTVSRSGREIELLPREFQVLEYLVRNEGQVVSRAMLLQHVWDLHFDPTTNIIDVYVGRVRRKVDGQQAYPLIHTIRGIGYCLRAPG